MIDFWEMKILIFGEHSLTRSLRRFNGGKRIWWIMVAFTQNHKAFHIRICSVSVNLEKVVFFFLNSGILCHCKFCLMLKIIRVVNDIEALISIKKNLSRFLSYKVVTLCDYSKDVILNIKHVFWICTKVENFNLWRIIYFGK